MTAPKSITIDLTGNATREEAAAFLRYKTKTLANFALLGRGPRFFKLGRGRSARVLYPWRDLIAWRDSQQVGGEQREAA